MKEKIRMLTAQGRVSAWVVGLSPFGLMLLFQLVAPEFMEPLFATRAGRGCVLLVIVLVLAGLWTVHRVVKVEP
jgi:tight adherence protein B